MGENVELPLVWRVCLQAPAWGNSMWHTETPEITRKGKDFSHSTHKITWYQVSRQWSWHHNDQQCIITESGRKDWAYELYTKWPEVVISSNWDVRCLCQVLRGRQVNEDLMTLIRTIHYSVQPWLICFMFQLNGTACCSDTAISFHYISPPMLYVMYYLVYHLRLTPSGECPMSSLVRSTLVNFRPLPPYDNEDSELVNISVEYPEEE